MNGPDSRDRPSGVKATGDLAVQIYSGLAVAAAMARQTGRAWAFDLSPDGGAGANRDASLPPFEGFARVHVVEPDAIPGGDEIMGLCKNVYTRLTSGGTVPDATLRALDAAHLARKPTLKNEDDAAIVSHLRAGPTGGDGGLAGAVAEAEARVGKRKGRKKATAGGSSDEMGRQVSHEGVAPMGRPNGDPCAVPEGQGAADAVLLPETPDAGDAVPPAEGLAGPAQAEAGPDATDRGLTGEHDAGEEYALDELVPLPAKCRKCGRNWTGRDVITAPPLDNCACYHCGGPLDPHPDFPGVVSAKERRRRLKALADEMRPAALAANAGVFEALAESGETLEPDEAAAGREANLRRLREHGARVAKRYAGESVTCYCDDCEAARVRLGLPRWPGPEGDRLISPPNALSEIASCDPDTFSAADVAALREDDAPSRLLPLIAEAVAPEPPTASATASTRKKPRGGPAAGQGSLFGDIG